MADLDDDELSALLRSEATRHRAGEALRSAIRVRLDAAAGQVPRSVRPAARARWLPLGLAFAFGLLLATALLRLAPLAGSADHGLETELVASHVRSLMAEHLTDVASSDRHTVKPWFQGRLDYSPEVPELAADGFVLIGGRLDYLAARPVAALVYRHGAHVVNVFVWPDGVGASKASTARHGYNLLRWHDGAMQYAAVSDLNAEELMPLARLLRASAQAAGSAAP
ncbi:anti-sigma factor [Methylibium sp.]|uniref:anti-sigma factor family protein n=2 Tax=Methylibium sp. TaxID=2067992 RepID=UPI00286BCFC4|nr:anti-sigma factor [Methylibium sp.]